MGLVQAFLITGAFSVARWTKDTIAPAIRSDCAWGYQVRSYVLQPYQLVKDLRTGVQTNDVQRVLDGGIDDFLRAGLIWQRELPPHDDCVVVMDSGCR